MADQPRSAGDVIDAVKQNDVRFVRLWFTDVLGQLKSFSINAAELEDAFDGGMGFDGSSITGFNPIEESDMIAKEEWRARGAKFFQRSRRGAGRGDQRQSPSSPAGPGGTGAPTGSPRP